MAALPGGTDVAVNHKFISGKADGADPTLVQPSKWNQNENLGQGADGQKVVRDSGQTDGASWVNYDTASLTNNTGGAAAVGDVVAVSLAADNTVVLDDTVSSVRRFVVALQTPAGAAVGAYGIYGPIPGVKAQGAIPAGNYIRKSATTKAVEDTGVAVASTTTPPNGTLGFATTAAAGGFVNVFWFAQTVVALGPTKQVFTASGTYTAPAGLVKALVMCIGAGGSGGGTSSGTAPGGGGGSGETTYRLLTAAQIGVSQTVTLNAGGAGIAANTNSAGNNGGTTTFGALLTANGGAGGHAGNAGGTPVAGGSGGANADWSIPGCAGTVGTDTGATVSLRAPGAGPGGGLFGSAGVANSGGGGGGGSTGTGSGAGALGKVVVLEFYA